MRIIFMGTGPFAVPALQSLINSEKQVVALVTRPSRPAKGRRQAPCNPVRDVGQRQRVALLEPQDVNSDSSRAQLAQRKPDLLVVCDFGQILTAATLQVAPLGGINLHASLLPKYRGAAPVNWALLQGETETGVTVIHMTPRMDAGPCLVQRSTKIDRDETAEALERRLAQMGVGPLHEAIDMLAGWDGTSPIGTLQDRSQASKAPRLKKSDGEVQWLRSAEQIRNQVRALKPWPRTFTTWQSDSGEALRLILDQVSPLDADPAAGAIAGDVVRADRQQVWVATGQGLLSLDKVQPAGKRVMDIAEFLRGHRIRAGDKMGPPESPSP